MRLKRRESDLKQIIAQGQGAKTRLKYAKTDLDNIRKKNIPQYQAVGHQALFMLMKFNRFLRLVRMKRNNAAVGFRRFLVLRMKEKIWTIRFRWRRTV